MKGVYNDLSFKISRLVTTTYSTSFSKAVGMLEREKQAAIFAIYGFVRFADEIVDTFHDHEKEYLLKKFEADYYDALRSGISLNPILNAFQVVVKRYRISDDEVQAFLRSMKTDLDKQKYDNAEEIGTYIYGSAEVVGLMCLRVFLNGNDEHFEELKDNAKRLGSAFQKVNFLRDFREDTRELKRKYFPETIDSELNDEVKSRIIADIEYDFREAYPGILKLPGRSRLAVLIAYRYYLQLLKRIDRSDTGQLLTSRIRVPDFNKFIIMAKSVIEYKLKLI
jgi:phytoene/squalene synthetase